MATKTAHRRKKKPAARLKPVKLRKAKGTKRPSVDELLDVPSPEQPIGSFWQTYRHETRRPLVSLAFLLPLVALYEGAVLWSLWRSEPAQIAGVQHWMHQALGWLGYGGLYLPPLAPIAVLLIWHIAESHPWRFRGGVLVVMAAESLLLSLALVAVLYLVLEGLGTALATTGMPPLRQVLLYVGAGIYEETLFRLILLPLLYVMGLWVNLPKRWAAVVAVIGSAVVFALAHHVGAGAPSMTAVALVYRTVAGMFFAATFVLRGFGVTVGVHVAYDVLVG